MYFEQFLSCIPIFFGLNVGGRPVHFMIGKMTKDTDFVASYLEKYIGNIL